MVLKFNLSRHPSSSIWQFCSLLIGGCTLSPSHPCGTYSVHKCLIYKPLSRGHLSVYLIHSFTDRLHLSQTCSPLACPWCLILIQQSSRALHPILFSLKPAKPGEVSQHVASTLYSSLRWVFYKPCVPNLCVVCLFSIFLPVKNRDSGITLPGLVYLSHICYLWSFGEVTEFSAPSSVK